MKNNLLKAYLQLEGMKDLKNYFIENGIRKEYKKGSFFLSRGDTSLYAGYVRRGAFRHMDYMPNGEEQVVGYSFEGDLVSDYISFQNRGASLVDIQAVQDSVVLTLTYQQVNDFYSNYKIADYRAKVAEYHMAHLYGQLLSLYCDTPEEKYLNLLERYPKVLDLINLKEVASYIGVTQETMSRIRKKIASGSK